MRESLQLRALLRHIVEETLAGRSDGLKEYSLGREVFHRPGSYDPRSDAIVRVQASLLRKRLASYYEHEGRDAAIRVELPRGGYVPVFREVDPAERAVPPPPALEPPKPDQAGSAAWGWWKIFGAGVAIGALIAAAVGLAIVNRRGAPPLEAPSLWGGFARPGTETVVSFGIPLFYTGGGGLYMRDVKVNTPGDEVKGRILQAAEALGIRVRPQEDVYTGVGDAIGTHVISRWLELHGVKTSVANSHDLGQSDITGRNLVVVSSIRFQTLLREMQLPSRIHFEPSTSGRFRVDNPLPGEAAYYDETGGTGVDTSYGLMSLWPGKKHGDKILYLTGITTWATHGVAHYSIDAERLRDLQRRLNADPEDGPRGKKSPYFQVLVRVEGKSYQMRTAEYVTHRYLPDADGAATR